MAGWAMKYNSQTHFNQEHQHASHHQTYHQLFVNNVNIANLITFFLLQGKRTNYSASGVNNLWYSGSAL